MYGLNIRHYIIVDLKLRSRFFNVSHLPCFHRFIVARESVIFSFCCIMKRKPPLFLE